MACWAHRPLWWALVYMTQRQQACGVWITLQHTYALCMGTGCLGAWHIAHCADLPWWCNNDTRGSMLALGVAALIMPFRSQRSMNPLCLHGDVPKSLGPDARTTPEAAYARAVRPSPDHVATQCPWSSSALSLQDATAQSVTVGPQGLVTILQHEAVVWIPVAV